MQKDDLISRADAVSAVENYYADHKYITRSRTTLSAICEDMKGTINALPSAQQWIPCSERLPRAGKNVLISMDDENVTVGCIVKIGKTKMWQIDIGEYPIDTFAAWMPLPEPYEVEE